MPTAVECREWFASGLQSSLRKDFPETLVRASGDLIVFTNPRVFEKRDDRSSFYEAVIQKSSLAASLCSFGFRKVRVESSANLEAAVGEESDLHCDKN
jgi:hypothetical protein